jgi:sugar/nucleoside kinase (ribokinase family)
MKTKRMETKDKTEVIVIGELNVDIILNGMVQFPAMGKEILAKSMNLTLGSSYAIFASNLCTLGTSVSFISKIGNDGFAYVVLDSLNAKGVNTSHVIQSDTLNTGATIVMNYDQDRTNVTYPGAMEDLKSEDIDFNFISTARHLHFSSIFLQPGIRENLPILFAKTKLQSLTTSLDPQWDPAEKRDVDLSELLPTLDIFMPNMAEFLLMTGTESLDEGVEKIKNIAPDIILIIKDGTNGSFGWKSGKLIHQPAYPNNDIVDCIGAGDSFNAGLINAFIKGHSLKQCLKTGALAGAVSTTCPGGTGAFETLERVRQIAVERFGTNI